MAFLSSSTCTDNTHSPLPLLLICISVPVVWAHRLAGREGLWSSIPFETLHRMEGDQIFRSVYARLLVAPAPLTTSRQHICTANTYTASDLDRLHPTGPMRMSTDLNNNASGAFSTGPASGYFLNLPITFVVDVASTMNNAPIFIITVHMCY